MFETVASLTKWIHIDGVVCVFFWLVEQNDYTSKNRVGI